MSRIAVIGAGITGVTTAYALARRGASVTVYDQARYPAMETSYANGGQLSASNAEVWNSLPMILKGLRWMLRRDAPLLLNPAPSWHKYSWVAEFLAAVPDYQDNTLQALKLALKAREHLFAWAEEEHIDFDLKRQGILHVYRDKASFDQAARVTALYVRGGLEREAVTPQQINVLEPALQGRFYGGFYTPSDASGDIHKFTRGLADACMRRGVTFRLQHQVQKIQPQGDVYQVSSQHQQETQTDSFDRVVICAGVASRKLAASLGDRVNVYPVKGYSITLTLADDISRQAAPQVSLLDEALKLVSSRLGDDRLRVAGTAEFSGFNKDIRANRLRPLIDWVETHFPQVATDQVKPWTGLRPMLPNLLPRLGSGKLPGIYYNTGHGHLGWTMSAATAEITADMMLPSISSLT